MACEGIIRNVKAIPADKLNWKPMENGRSVLDQFAECAASPEIMKRALSGQGYNYLEEDTAKRKSLTTLEAAEQALRSGNQRLMTMIRELPDSRLSEKVNLPWGDTWSLCEIANMHYWNLVYHIGQINYIQTLLGDFEMH